MRIPIKFLLPPIQKDSPFLAWTSHEQLYWNMKTGAINKAINQSQPKMRQQNQTKFKCIPSVMVSRLFTNIFLYLNALPQNPKHWSFYFAKMTHLHCTEPNSTPTCSFQILPTHPVRLLLHPQQCLVFPGELGQSFELHGQRAGSPGGGKGQGRKGSDMGDGWRWCMVGVSWRVCEANTTLFWAGEVNVVGALHTTDSRSRRG